MEDSLLAELMRKITRYFDKEMNSNDERQFLQEIVKHPAGLNAFNKEKNIRQKLRANLRRPSDTSHIVDHIRKEIRKFPH